MSNTSTLLTVENIFKSYKQSNKVVDVLDDVSFELMRNKITMIMGPSGSGKTTLLSIIGLLTPADKGHIIMNGQDLLKLTQKQKQLLRYKEIGFVFQTANLIPALSALDNVVVANVLNHDSNAQLKRRALDLLKQVGLESRAHHLPHQLSRGEQQRVALARALINDPKIILADEPTGSLDPEAGQTVMKLIRELSQIGERAAIVVTHDNRIEPFADKILYLSNGTIRHQLASYSQYDESLLRELTDAVIMINGNYEVTLVNHQAEKLLGWDEVSLRRQTLPSILNFMKPDSDEVLNISDVVKNDKEQIVAVNNRHGERLIIELKATRFNDGEQFNSILTMRDITDSYYLEKRKDAFISQASHNLRTPLTSIKGYLQVALDESSDAKQKRTALERINVSLTDLEFTIERLLMVTNLENITTLETREPVSINKFIEKIVTFYMSMAKQKGIDLKFTSNISNSVQFFVNTLSMRIAIANVVENALTFTQQGSVTIQVKKVAQQLVIIVSDTGTGIEQGVLNHIFDRFSRGQQGYTVLGSGLGLGLYLTKRIINIHGGYIDIESELDKGTTVRMSFPLDQILA